MHDKIADMLDKIKGNREKYNLYVGWALSFLGIVISIFGLYNSTEIKKEILFTTLLISYIIVIIFCALTFFAYEKSIKYSNKAELMISNEKNKAGLTIDSLNNRLEHFEKLTKELIKFNKNINKRINSFLTLIYNENDIYLATIKTFKDQSGLIETEQKEEFEKICKLQLHDAKKRYSNDLISLYNQFLRGIIDETKNIIEYYIALKGYELAVSVTLKLFSETIDDPDYSNEVVVFSAFRDKKTYEEGKREIGKKEYSISENIDFSTCLRKERYICNNVQKNDDNYMNEHADFDQYYNCAVTVPIVSDYRPKKKIMGYLCCDVLNNKYPEEKIMNVEVSNILYTSALTIGTFLDNATLCWDFMIDEYDSEELITYIYNSYFY